MLKHLNGLSDEAVVDMLKRDLYAQYLCDVSLKEAQKFINSSTLTYFRKQIGPEGVKLIEQEVLNTLKKPELSVAVVWSLIQRLCQLTSLARRT